jgi:hypothetical protein
MGAPFIALFAMSGIEGVCGGLGFGLETWGHELYRFPLMPQVRGHEWGTQCVGHPPPSVWATCPLTY